MELKDKVNKILTHLGLQEEEPKETVEVQLEETKLDNGTVLEAESFEAGKAVYVKSEDEKVPVPAGEYSLEDGKVLVVEPEGQIKAISDKKEEEPSEEAVEEQEMGTEEPSAKKVVESVSKETFFSEIEKLQTEIKDLKLSLEKKEEEIKESKEVELSAKPIKHNPEIPENKQPFVKGKNKLDTIYNLLNR